MFIYASMGVNEVAESAKNLAGYFTNLPKFVGPVSDYHAFYLFWWLSWSIMIGQFVARFTGGVKAWQLMLAMLIVPSIPIAVWFSVLYNYYVGELIVPKAATIAMVVVGIIFVINSLDSLMRLYNDNLNLSVERLGKTLYLAGNWLALFGLILLYQFTPLKIEWIGLLVIGLYLGLFVLMWQRRKLLPSVAG